MKFVIFGAGGLAKELIGYIANSHGLNSIQCIVSTEPFNNPIYQEKFTVKSSIEPGEYPDASFLLAVADPNIKKQIVETNENRWSTYIHPSCEISPFAKIGKGCVLAPQCIVVGDAIIEDFNFMNTNATVGHDSIVGKWSTMFPNTEICGDCIIGESCIFGIGAYVLPKQTLAANMKVSAGAVVRKSFDQATTLYGDPAMPRVKG